MLRIIGINVFISLRELITSILRSLSAVVSAFSRFGGSGRLPLPRLKPRGWGQQTCTWHFWTSQTFQTETPEKNEHQIQAGGPSVCQLKKF